MPKIYLVGAHGTGKTTLAQPLAQLLGLPIVSEVARQVLAGLGVTLAQVKADARLATEFQWGVHRNQLLAEKEALEISRGKGFVADRGPDHLVYAALQAGAVAALWEDARDHYLPNLQDRDAFLFLLKPWKPFLVADGTRTTDWDGVIAVDAGLTCLLEWRGIPYTTLAHPDLDVRISTVLCVAAPRAYRQWQRDRVKAQEAMYADDVPASAEGDRP